MTDNDIIDTLAGVAPGSPLALIRDRKPVTRLNAQKSHAALFEPTDTVDVTLQERFAIASFVAGLHGQDQVTAFYADRLHDTAPPYATALASEVERGRTTGPYGAYPAGKLTEENVSGPTYHAAETNQAILGPRLTAALGHVHMLVFHPRDASPESLQALLDAGWSNAGIVTLSQLVAFLAFQIRAVAGLRTLASA